MFLPKNRFRVRLEKIQHLTPRKPTGRLYPVGYEHEGYIWTEEQDLGDYLVGRRGVGPVVVLATRGPGIESGTEGAAFRTSMVEEVSRVRADVYHVRTPNSVWQVTELPNGEAVETASLC